MLRYITVLACLAALASCGGSSSSSHGSNPAASSSTTTSAAPSPAASSAQSTPAAASAPHPASQDPRALVTLPGGPVAVVAGTRISRATLDHWMTVAAKSQASQSPGQPLIVPTDPPAFAACIAQVRRTEPSLDHTSAKVVKATCSELYRTLSSQVMAFLIQSQWYLDQAAHAGIRITDAQVTKTFEAEKAKSFPTAAAFNRFLSSTGQTLPDITFRVRVDEALSALSRRAHGNQTKVSAAAKAAWRPKTFCAPDVIVADCSEYR